MSKLKRAFRLWKKKRRYRQQLNAAPQSGPRKLNVGCGENKLDGWENYDEELDIREPLCFRDATFDFILAEHVVEHVHVHDAYRFFAECKRVLKPGGVLRLCLPGIDRIRQNWTAEYGSLIQKNGFGDDTLRGSIEAILFKHGHEAAWTEELLLILLEMVGFEVHPAEPGKSSHRELNGVDGHWRIVGEEINRIETIVVEAVRPT